MKRIYILCEGHTEEIFINNILKEDFYNYKIELVPIIIKTSRTLQGVAAKGGLSTYAKFKKELVALCNQHKNETITTMIDYYELPNDFPSYNTTQKDIYKKITKIESDIEMYINRKNLIAYISLHEFETLLYSNPAAFATLEKDISSDIAKIVLEFGGNVELINSDKSPSKRILALYDKYSKTVDAIKLSKVTGMQCILKNCKHFEQWIEKLRAI